MMARKLSAAMRKALAEIVQHPDAELVHDFRSGWRLREKDGERPPNGFQRWRWLAHPTAGTVDALVRRALLEVQYPRTTPGIYIVTAVLTDAGREAAVSCVSPIGLDIP